MMQYTVVVAQYTHYACTFCKRWLFSAGAYRFGSKEIDT